MFVMKQRKGIISTKMIYNSVRQYTNDDIIFGMVGGVAEQFLFEDKMQHDGRTIKIGNVVRLLANK